MLERGHCRESHGNGRQWCPIGNKALGVTDLGASAPEGPGLRAIGNIDTENRANAGRMCASGNEGCAKAGPQAMLVTAMTKAIAGRA